MLRHTDSQEWLDISWNTWHAFAGAALQEVKLLDENYSFTHSQGCDEISQRCS